MEMGLGLLQVGSPGRFPGPLEKSLLEAAGLGHVYAGEREMSRSGLWVFFLAGLSVQLLLRFLRPAGPETYRCVCELGFSTCCLAVQYLQDGGFFFFFRDLIFIRKSDI